MKLFNRKNDDIEELKNRITILEDKVSKLEKNSYKLPNRTVGRGKDKKARKPYVRNKPITEFAGYNTFKLQRQYDERVDCFFSSTNRGDVKINLTFLELVEVIKEYKKGHNGTMMAKGNILLSKFSSHALQNYTYIYRAGGFNDAIKKYAPKKGYNADKLISREVEE